MRADRAAATFNTQHSPSALSTQKSFSAVIQDAAAADRHADGRAVDLQAAERRERCAAASAAFEAVLPAVQALASRRGPCMARARELAAAIESIVLT